jgi:acyl-CoA thioester hydrolase
VPSTFTYPITATLDDIDDLGHVSNLVYLRWVLETATAHSSSLGWDLDAYRKLGNVWVVRRHELDYLGQVTVGQSLVATTWVESWKQVSCIRKTELARDGQVVARCATTWAFMALASGKPQRIPEQLAAAFQ